eukprot:262611_1
MKLQVPVTIGPSFDCKLNPKRSHLLVTRYCSVHGYSEMAMDVISIIILFFNQCLYWKVDQRQEKQFDFELAFGLNQSTIYHQYSFGALKDEIKWPKAMDRIHIPASVTEYEAESQNWRSGSGYIDIYDTLVSYRRLRHYLSKTYTDEVELVDEHEEMMTRYSCKDYVGNVYPIINIFNMYFTVRNSDDHIYLELKRLSAIKWMTIRIRVFCVETEEEIVKLLVVKPYEEYKICNYEALGVFSCNLNIGTQVEIVHILYENDGNYWSKCPYSFFCHIVDLHLSGQCINYHNARCFRINDQYYYRMDSRHCRRLFCDFVDFYANEFTTFPYHIIFLGNDSGSGSQSCLSDYLKTTKCRNHLKPVQQYRREDILMAMKRDSNLLKSPSQYKSCFKHAESHKNKVCYDRGKKPKYNRSKKQRYKYHRW